MSPSPCSTRTPAGQSSLINGKHSRLDIAINGFWGGQFEYCYVDVYVLNPYAPSNANSISSVYRCHENIKRCAYGQWIREVEHASFTPLGVWPQRQPPSTNDLPPWGDEYCVVMGWIHCYLSFSLLRSAITCICAAQSSLRHFFTTPPLLDLMWIESQMIVDNTLMAW